MASSLFIGNRAPLALLLLLLVLAVGSVEASPPAQVERVAPTYTIFATREGLVGHMTANGHIIQPHDRFVALPSWDVLSKAGTSTYEVRITYKGRSVVAPVWDVGPWNTNDDYWSPTRAYSDLPVGLPAAQAAFYEGYNDGRDEFGRTVRNPNGIDIADGTFWDDLQMTRNDWVQVSFLWLGSDPGPGNAIAVPRQSWGGEPAQPGRRLITPDPLPPPYQPAPSSDNPPIEPGAIVVDNQDSGYSASQSPWYAGTCGMNGSHVWTYSTSTRQTSTSRASWVVLLPTIGLYDVKAYIPPCGTTPATREARYIVTHDNGVEVVSVNQAAFAGQWVSLGIFRFGGRVNPMVELFDMAGDERRSVRFDALSWRRVPMNP